MATTNNQERSEKLRKTLEKTLSSAKANKVIDSAIKDLSSSKGLSLRTIFLGAKFVLTNPVNTYNLVKLAKSSDIYLAPEFQKSLLEKTPIWEFLKKNADNLPKIGQILAKAGFKEFQENNFLDQKGLEILKESFKHEEVLKKLQEVAVEVKKEAPDWTRVTSIILDMLAKDENFKKFFNAKGKDISNYIKVGATEILADDYVRTFNDILQNPKKKNLYSEVIKIFDQNPDFKQKLAENINNSTSLKEFSELSSEKQKMVKNFVEEAKQQAKPALKEYFESYRIDPKVLSTVPTLLNQIPEIKEIFDTLNNPDKGVMIALEKTLEMTKNNEELKNFFANNKEFLPNAALGIIENNPDLQKMTNDYNFDKQMLNIVGEVMSQPERAYEIMVDVHKGNYMGVTTHLITSLNEPSFKLKDVLLEQSKNGLFDNLIKGALEQDEKSGGAIKKQLENYGLKAGNVTKLTGVMPLLLDKPESLQKVFGSFVKGDYTGMAKELIILTKEKPEIKQYLNDNIEIFSTVLDKALVDIPGVGGLDNKGLLKELPIMLNHPNELVAVIEAVEKKEYTSAVTTALYNLGITGVAKGVKYVAQAGTHYATQAVTNMFNTASQPIENKITDIDTLIDQAIDKVWLQAQAEGNRNLPNKKEFTQQIKKLSSGNQNLRDYIIEKLSSNPINNVGDVSTPKVNQYKNAKDHINSPLQVLNPLYENIINKEDIRSNLAANMMSEQIPQKLFGEGNNRGEDFYMIRQTLKQVISDYVKENPENIDNLLDPENQKKLNNNIAETLKAKSKYTLAGLATGGIYLPKEIFNDELKNNFKNKLIENLYSNVLVEAKNVTTHFKNMVTIADNQHKSPPSNTPTSSLRNENTRER